MNNPWVKIDLATYETHMSSDSVFQLQTLNQITRQQLTDHKHSKVAILGIAGGNVCLAKGRSTPKNPKPTNIVGKAFSDMDRVRIALKFF